VPGHVPPEGAGRGVTERWLSVRDAATRSGFKVDAIRRAIARGELEAYKVCGRVRIAEEALERFMRSEPVAEAPPVKPKPARSGNHDRRGRSGEPSFRDMARRSAAS
jgi:excisionase family DNA binding protein